MDTGLNVRPVQTISTAPVRAEAQPERQVARTELPEARAVTAAANSQPVQFDKSDPQQALRAKLNNALDVRLSPPTTKVDMDDASQQLVFRKISQSSGQVVQQYPDEAILRQRAYAVQQRRAELEMAIKPSPEVADERIQRVA
jgi:uncharacterized FlaG/YvyC family protein